MKKPFAQKFSFISSKNSSTKLPVTYKLKKRFNRGHTKYNTDYCDNQMTFDECELAILRHAVDETEELQKQKISNSDDIKQMIRILEDFLIKKKLICYGGTAINNILPKYAQFYNRDIEVPDYDFFSKNAMEDAKELADIFYNAGYLETEAKSGVHKGTYKVFVNYIPMADITQLHPDLYNSIERDAITVAGIKYAPPNYLRMSMFLELSRPAGDVSRWEKVFKRLTLLNKFYPLKPTFDCKKVDFQRKTETVSPEDTERIYYILRDSFIEQGVVFFGGYASSLYSKYMGKTQRDFIKKIPDFDILAEDIDRVSLIIQERLFANGFTNIQTIEHENIDDVIPRHIEIKIGKETLAFLFAPVACHNYNTIRIQDKEINIATIDTMLSFYLAFIYADKPYFETDRILCMAQYLFDVEQKNRLEQKGLLKRFSISCYGKQPTLETMRAEKADKFRELSNNRNSREWNEWFFKYSPNQMNPAKGETVASSPITSSPITSIQGNEKVKSKHTKKQTKKRRKSNNQTIRKLFGLKKSNDFLY